MILKKEDVRKISTAKAQEWLKDAILEMKNGPKNGQRPKLVPLQRISPRQTGRMIMFFYDPKTKETLPYYDMFPLVLPIRMLNDGFIGINLHYLPINYRFQLLSAITDVQFKDKHLNENKRLQLSYNILQSSTRFKYFKPCVKRYLYSHVRNFSGQNATMQLVDPEQWKMVVALPVERFVKASKQKVWAESLRQIGVNQ